MKLTNYRKTCFFFN